MSEKLYTLTLSEPQAQAVARACELLARIGMSQLDMVVDALPNNDAGYSALRAAMERAEASVKPLIGLSGGGYYGIRNAQVPINAKRAWDVYAVIRHRMSWDRAISDGVIKPGESRNWKLMFGVNYDEPDNVAGERLPSMTFATPSPEEK